MTRSRGRVGEEVALHAGSGWQARAPPAACRGAGARAAEREIAGKPRGRPRQVAGAALPPRVGSGWARPARRIRAGPPTGQGRHRCAGGRPRLTSRARPGKCLGVVLSFPGRGTLRRMQSSATRARASRCVAVRTDHRGLRPPPGWLTELARESGMGLEEQEEGTGGARRRTASAGESGRPAGDRRRQGEPPRRRAATDGERR